MAQQLQQHAASSAQTQPSVSLNISAEESTDPAPWSVRGRTLDTDRQNMCELEYLLVSVDASDLGVYYLDEKLFIDKLCETNTT